MLYPFLLGQVINLQVQLINICECYKMVKPILIIFLGFLLGINFYYMARYLEYAFIFIYLDCKFIYLFHMVLF